MKKIIIKIFSLSILTLNVFAQQNIPANPVNNDVLVKGKLNDQYEFILKNSDTYNNYKVIKIDWLKNYQTNVLDSINKLKTEHTVINQKLLTIQNEVSVLESENILNEELLKKRDTISFLGIPVEKMIYQGIMWTLVLLLAGGFGYFAYKYKKSHVLTKDALLRYDELESEFNEARSRALEREQILNRKLFDEQKKNKS